MLCIKRFEPGRDDGVDGRYVNRSGGEWAHLTPRIKKGNQKPNDKFMLPTSVPASLESFPSQGPLDNYPIVPKPEAAHGLIRLGSPDISE